MTNHGGWANEPTSYGLQPPGAPEPEHFTPGTATAPMPLPTLRSVPQQPSADNPYISEQKPAEQKSSGQKPAAPAPSEAPVPGAGRLVGGRYRLISRLGHGGMGTVWKARDEVIDRDVAVKEPRVPDHLPEHMLQQIHQRMLREARAAARIEHPAVVTVHDVVEEDGRPWIVMEMVHGRSLADQLAEGTLEPREAARVGLAVLGALAAAHEAGVLHRDVKPDNVLLGRDEQVVLTDFGIAQIEGEQGLTETGAFVGSPEFVAPERAAGRRPGPESDLWSLGVVLYAAVEGVSPFRRSNTQATMQAIISAQPQSPVRAEGPLGTLIMRLLSKDAADRPAPAEIRRTLEDLARPLPPQPPAPATPAAPPAAAGNAWVPPVLQGNRKAQFGLLSGVLAAAVTASLVVLDPFAEETIPPHWKVRDEPEIVKASLAVPEDYVKAVDAEKGWVGFEDPSGIFNIYLTRRTEEPKSAYSTEHAEIGSAEQEADKLAQSYKEGKVSGVDDPTSTTVEAPRHQGMEAAETVTVYRRSGNDEKAPKRAIRQRVIVNEDENVSWDLEVRMPAAGQGRKDGDKLFEDVLKYLTIQEAPAEG
ncbi:serine/threonine protein kinase [Streptomyces sp. SCA3-4]|uniref:serine/threonine-protein kinase n=1 Tax=Streptomyces sichuanensis TaxID=2871810 RepID=UPI001CE3AE0D|nr:serine/threonine-protein kinase [Streptomyces sichuanensis]MCA6092454.1 serine/threonine protein kinase [Streptomyces sichuanensis]